jgi:hypothetical protein
MTLFLFRCACLTLANFVKLCEKLKTVADTINLRFRVNSRNLTSTKLKYFAECRRGTEGEGHVKHFGEYKKIMFKKVQLKWRRIFGGEAVID